MTFDDPHKSAEPHSAPDHDKMRAANVNPETRLATDYLNLFNEYVMLAELVEDGSLDREMLEEWQPLSYEQHFVQSNFKSHDVVIAAYRTMSENDRADFDEAVGGLLDLILTHQAKASISAVTLTEISHHRDFVAGLINGVQGAAVQDSAHKQADIDAFLTDEFSDGKNDVCVIPLTPQA